MKEYRGNIAIRMHCLAFLNAKCYNMTVYEEMNMRKKLLMLGNILLLVSSFLLVTRLQKSNFDVFNKVSESYVDTVKSTLEQKPELEFTALLCNETRVPFDDLSSTFYVPVNMEEKKWEKMEFVSGQKEYEIAFLEDITVKDKQRVIADGEKIEIIVYDQMYWATYYVVFTGLPIIDFATNEGFYATEEITGSASFYDVDFTLHGVEQSAYNGHIRGNTSRMFPKKGYKLNLTYINEYGVEDGNKLSLFGMRKDDDWILHALYNDDTKIRDRLSIEIWDRIGANEISENSYYGTRMSYVEVFADNQYCGLYGLFEPIDAKQLGLAEEDYSYKRKNPGGIRYKFDDFSEASATTVEIEGFELKDGILNESSWMPMANLSSVMTSHNWEEKLQKSQIINEDNLIRMWIFIQMITGHDHTAKNMFFVAKYDEDLRYDYQFSFAPWDMDLTWGNVSVGETNPFYTEFKMDTLDNRVYWEIADMLIDSNYNQVKNRAQVLYNELRQSVITDEEIENMILMFDNELRASGAFARDQQRWPEGTHAKDTSVLQKYAKERLNFLDIAINDFTYFEE